MKTNLSFLGLFVLLISISIKAKSETAPYDIIKFQDYLAQCKLQAPESNTEATADKIMDGHSSEYFYVVDEDKIAFTQEGYLKRTELRHETDRNFMSANQIFHTRLKIAEQTCEQVTVVQIHDNGNISGNPNKPLLRIYKHTNKDSKVNHLWAAIKTDDGGENTDHFDLGEDAGDYFDCDVVVEEGYLKIYINDEQKVSHDISYWTYSSYWKNGVYLQDEGTATAYFDEMTLTVTPRTYEETVEKPADLMRNCLQWKIDYPDGSSSKDVCNESNNEYYFLNDDNTGIVFRAPIRMDNGTTPNSDYRRSELREMKSDGSTEMYWTTRVASHMVYVKQAITHLPIKKDELVATQIHGDKDEGIDDAMVLRLEDSHLFLSFNGGNLRSDLTIKTDYELGTIHEVIFLVVEGKHYCYYSEDGNLEEAYQNGTADQYLVKDPKQR